MTDRHAASDDSGWIGRSELRREDLRLTTGHGRFVDNVSLPGMAHMVLVRSPLAHANVLGIDATGAVAAPGVLAVF
ncbi:MAG: hypothetical protein ACRDG2_10615, partial [Actinomycetota bacterium]